MLARSEKHGFLKNYIHLLTLESNLGNKLKNDVNGGNFAYQEEAVENYLKPIIHPQILVDREYYWIGEKE